MFEAIVRIASVLAKGVTLVTTGLAIFAVGFASETVNSLALQRERRV